MSGVEAVEGASEESECGAKGVEEVRFEEALVQARELCESLDRLSRHEDCRVAERAAADRLAVEIMVAWARRAYELGVDDVLAVDMLNVVHGV